MAVSAPERRRAARGEAAEPAWLELGGTTFASETTDKAALVKRLHRIGGQVRGIEKMVEDDRCCIDVLTQVGAVTIALEALAFKLLEDHVRRCIAGARAVGDADEARAKIEELLTAVQRFSRIR